VNAGPVEDWVAGLLSPAPEPAAARAPPEGAVVMNSNVQPAADRPPEAPAVPVEENAGQPEMPTRFVTFRVAGETYALDVLRVREVLRTADIVPVPGAPDSVLGVINLRGSIVPVVDARHRLGLAPPPPEISSRVLIMESGWQAVGLLVDSVADVTTVGAGDYEPPPAVGSGESARCLRGVVRREDEFMILVDVDDLLPSARDAMVERPA